MKKYLLLVLVLILPLAVIIYYAIFFSIDGGMTYAGKPCIIYKLTGFDCPGCGGQRMIYHILNGEIQLAIKNNLLFFLGAPILGYFYYCCIQVYIFKRRRYLDKFVFHPKFAVIFIASIVIFTILRNIPFIPFNYLNSH